MAAVLACGDHAALSHTSGLAHWDLRGSSDPKIDTLDLHPTHRGRGPLMAVLDLYRYRDDELTRSELEALLRALCDAHDLPRPLVNHTIGDDEVDFSGLTTA